MILNLAHASNFRAANAFIAMLLAATCSFAAHGAPRATLWDLRLGASVAELPTDQFRSFGCGSNGGGPLMPLADWSGYSTCRPGPDGLYEVYFEYDDEVELSARARDSYVAPILIGTAEAYFPIVASALFAADGTLSGLRLVTDPRPEEKQADALYALRPREEHYLLGLYLMDRFGLANTDCESVPPEPGETAVVGQMVKSRCAKDDIRTGRRYLIESHYLRKVGQHDVDPQTGHLTTGQFDSWTRAEMTLLR